LANMISAPRGTKDVTPDQVYKWQYIEAVARRTAEDFGFREIRFPTFEHTELFVRGVGDTTDVVQKEMYTFTDKGGRSISLRPEGTASVVRSYLENSLYAAGLPVKAYYIAPVFRYEKPQSGRLREHHQFGVECFGAGGPEADSEIIALGSQYLSRLGIKKVVLEINSIGCTDCRKDFHKDLRDYFSGKKEELCPTCLDRLDRNPMRILDCKSKACKSIALDAPTGLDYLCSSCKDHFEKLQDYLDAMDISYKINPQIVRGLDYYTGTVFEFISTLDENLTIIGGGRYDGLVSELGGKPTPGLGFGSGIERMLLALEAEGIEIPKPGGVTLFVASQSEKTNMAVQVLVNKLRKLGMAAERDITGRSLKAQMKYSDRIGADYTAVIGESELESGLIKLKEMKSGEQTECKMDAEAIFKLLSE
jgi:histidyl-tRNA synthetase